MSTTGSRGSRNRRSHTQKYPIPFALPDLGRAEANAVLKVMQSGWLSTGSETKAFEKEFASSVGVEHAVAVNSNTSGFLALMTQLGVNKDWVVYSPTMTFSGPTMMAHLLGADVRLIDVSPATFLMDLNSLEHQLKRSPVQSRKLVIPVHYAGFACDMEPLLALCQKFRAVVIEDAAHAFPTQYPKTWNLVGSRWDTFASVFSFYATKTLTTGEGGMITTSSDSLAASLRKIVSHGISRDAHDRYQGGHWKYDVAGKGLKLNMPDLCSSIGRVQLKRSIAMWEKREELAVTYDLFLNKADIGGLHTPNGKAPSSRSDQYSSWHLYVVSLPEWADRDLVYSKMRDRGIGCSVHYTPLNQHSFWKKTVLEKHRICPLADEEAPRMLSLPIFSKMRPGDAKRAALTLIEILREEQGCKRARSSTKS